MYVLLPAMLGPVMSRIACPSLAAAAHVVGDERAVGGQQVEHRMPAVDDLEHRLLDNARPAIAALPGQRRQPASTSNRANTAAEACSRRAQAAVASRSSTNNCAPVP